jgi:hypothetical protein
MSETTREDEIRERAENYKSANQYGDVFVGQYVQDATFLLAEIERLRAELESNTSEEIEFLLRAYAYSDEPMTKGALDLKQMLLDAVKKVQANDPLTVRLPCKAGDTVYAIVYCESIVMDCDDDYETGTGARECPFEIDCPFEECDDNNRRIVETTVSGFWFDETKIDVFLDREQAEIYASDFGKTVFLTLAEAEAAKEAQG